MSKEVLLNMFNKILEKVIQIILKVLPHVCLIISLAYIVLYIIDRVNPSMDFIGFWFTKAMLLALAITSAVLGVVVIIFLNSRRK